jgi:hypothetical protein
MCEDVKRRESLRAILPVTLSCHQSLFEPRILTELTIEFTSQRRQFCNQCGLASLSTTWAIITGFNLVLVQILGSFSMNSKKFYGDENNPRPEPIPEVIVRLEGLGQL